MPLFLFGTMIKGCVPTSRGALHATVRNGECTVTAGPHTIIIFDIGLANKAPERTRPVVVGRPLIVWESYRLHRIQMAKSNRTLHFKDDTLVDFWLEIDLDYIEKLSVSYTPRFT